MKNVFVQNIISPYRNRFFCALNKEDFDFSVYYMGYTEPDRNWDTSKIERQYNSWVDTKGLYLKIGALGGHFNPRLVWKVLVDKNIKNIILAVSWNDPNILLITLVKRLHLTKKKLHFWAEANYTASWTNKHNSRLKWWLKRSVFNAIDGALIIPGKMSKITFEKWDINNKQFIYLPNTIDDTSLHFEPSLRNTDDLPVFIMPIRIIERVKGGLNFFEAIGKENVVRAQFIIAGDGEDKDKFIDYIKDNGFESNINLMGFCDSFKMSELYSKANAFILPSFSDPSPLSLVEALYFHLPVLCSDHCGNHFEAVEDGDNGLTFSPLSPDSIKLQFERFMLMRDKWERMGERSAEIYKERFNTVSVIKQFVADYSKVSF
ncbi:MAG: glycosyltransferase [Bacteroidales bacterium]|nr:glycosyltransferase [Bacteroidales bacterium]